MNMEEYILRRLEMTEPDEMLAFLMPRVQRERKISFICSLR